MTDVESSRRTAAVKRRALELGFNAVGIPTLEPSAYSDAFAEGPASGYAGDMPYLPRPAERRTHPARIVPPRPLPHPHTPQ